MPYSDPEKAKAYRKRYRERKREKLNAASRAYYAENKGKWAQYTKDWAQSNPEQVREIHSRKFLLKKYGLTPEQYTRLLEKQKGVCALCGGVNKDGAKLAVDHCHETGRVRGLLCRWCNSVLGRWGDNEEGILKVLKYLRKPQS